MSLLFYGTGVRAEGESEGAVRSDVVIVEQKKKEARRKMLATEHLKEMNRRMGSSFNPALTVTRRHRVLCLPFQSGATRLLVAPPFSSPLVALAYSLRILPDPTLLSSPLVLNALSPIAISPNITQPFVHHCLGHFF